MLRFARDVAKVWKHHTRRSSPLSAPEAKELANAQRAFILVSGASLSLSAVGITKKILAVREMQASERTKRDVDIYARKCIHAAIITYVATAPMMLNHTLHFTPQRLVKGGMFPPKILSLGLFCVAAGVTGPLFTLIYKHDLLDEPKDKAQANEAGKA